MSFFKTIRVHGRSNFQLRVEMFNAFNGVQWGNPNTTITSAQFGQVTETQQNDPRFIQLAFRYSF